MLAKQDPKEFFKEKTKQNNSNNNNETTIRHRLHHEISIPGGREDVWNYLVDTGYGPADTFLKYHHT